MVKVQINIPVEPELKKRLKRFCNDKDDRQKYVVETALDEYLTKRGYAKEEK